jgi:hypothetical protein
MDSFDQQLREDSLELAALLTQARSGADGGPSLGSGCDVVGPGRVGQFDNSASVRGVLDRWEAGLPSAGEVEQWGPDAARAGLVVLERIERRLAGVRAALVKQMAAGRDTAAAIARATGMSARDAKEAEKVARTVEQVPAAAELLERGEVSAAQVGAVAGLSAEEAAELLTVAAGMSTDEFANEVRQFRTAKAGPSLGARQHASRSVRFFSAAEGCVGMTAVLPPLVGAEIRSLINGRCDDQYRAQHPDRAETLGGHDVEPRERRLADALVSLVRGEGVAGPVGSSKSAGPAGSNTPGQRGSAGVAPAGRPTVIVTVEAETLRTVIVGHGPVGIDVVPELLARADVYAAIRDGTNRAQMQFGRNRRVASALQRLALLAIRDRCWVDGCDVPADRCEAHHETEWEKGGRTDLEELTLVCKGHHRHHHVDTPIVADRNGRYSPRTSGTDREKRRRGSPRNRPDTDGQGGGR